MALGVGPGELNPSSTLHKPLEPVSAASCTGASRGRPGSFRFLCGRGSLGRPTPGAGFPIDPGAGIKFFASPCVRFWSAFETMPPT